MQVPIGGIAVATPPTVLTTLLGSCVGMIVQDLRHHVIALAHVVRPEGKGAGMGPGYFADQAARNARDLALQNGADPRQLVVRIAGGGSMGGSGGIGRANAAAIKEATYQLDMVFGGHVDGPVDGGCVMFADPAKGKVLVKRLNGDLDDRAWRQLVEDVIGP